jgi:hypothetical protein
MIAQVINLKLRLNALSKEIHPIWKFGCSTVKFSRTKVMRIGD